MSAGGAGLLSDRIGPRPLIAKGLGLQAIGVAWIAAVIGPHVPYASLVAPFAFSAGGMALVFAPAANSVLAAVRPEEAGKASSVNNAIRDIGGVFGVAVLASIFSSAGSFATPPTFAHGVSVAAFAGAGVLAAGVPAALAVPGRERPGSGSLLPLDLERAAVAASA